MKEQSGHLGECIACVRYHMRRGIQRILVARREITLNNIKKKLPRNEVQPRGKTNELSQSRKTSERRIGKYPLCHSIGLVILLVQPNQTSPWGWTEHSLDHERREQF